MDLQLGSTGDFVSRLEQRLGDLGLYTGPIDGIFGGGVESGVKSFQKANALQPDGVVGAQTWTALFPDAALPVPALLNQPIAQRCLALTGAFETSTGLPDCYCGLTGDFDGQGMSYGVLQWNIGQGTLQPLFSDMLAAHRDIMANIFHDNLGAMMNMLASPRDAQLAFVRSIQDPNRHVVFEPWKGLFQALGRTPEFQAIQTNHAERIHQNALDLCGRYGVSTERALALMFDICVQNGSISAATESIIRADFDAIPVSADPMVIEVARLQAIANRRAEAASPRFVEDVRTRKLTIANGQGVVHSIPYHLEEQFGIRLKPAVEANMMGAS
jgi:hypothetical protein